MGFRPWLLAPLALAPLACTLLTDLDGYAGPDPSAPGATVAEGGVDVVNVDGGGSEASTSFCVPGQHTFCADFDQGDLLDGWTRDARGAGATLSLSEARFLSPGRSLRVQTPRLDAGAAKSDTTLEKDIPDWRRRTVLEADLYVPKPGWQQGDINAALLTLEGQSDTIDVLAYFVVSATQTQLVQPGGDTKNGPELPWDRWVHARIEIDLTKGISAAVADSRFDIPFALTGLTPGTSARTSFKVGVVNFNAPVAALDVHYDNVTLDFP